MKVNELVRAYDFAEALREESGRFHVTTTAGNSTTKGLVSMTKVVVKTFLILAAASMVISGLAYADGGDPDCTTGAPACTFQAFAAQPSTTPGLITVDIDGRAAQNTGSLTTNGVVVDFSGVTSGNGITTSGTRPKAGVMPAPGTGGAPFTPLYLQGDFGSGLAPLANVSNVNFFIAQGSPGTITMNFAGAGAGRFESLALLWGSNNATNLVSLLDGSQTIATVNGSTVLPAANSLAATFTPTCCGTGGDQFLSGSGPSAWVVITDTDGFTGATFSNTTGSPFEFTGVAAFNPTPVSTPEPSSVWTVIIGFGMIGFGIIVAAGRRRRERDVLHS